MKATTAIYAGTFDPFTSGHRDIAERALGVFGRLVVAVAADTGKNAAPLVDRVRIAELSLDGLCGVTVVPFEGLLTDFAAAEENAVIVRGIRNAGDLEYERGLCRIYKSLANVECVFLDADAKYGHVSSTAVRQLAALGAPLVGYVQDVAAAEIKRIYAK